MTATYWEIGRRIVEFEQGGADRATYGDTLIERLAKDLTQRFGRGFSRQNLGQMRAFYRAWPAQIICQTLSGKSSIGSVLETLSRESLAAAAAPQPLHETDGLYGGSGSGIAPGRMGRQVSENAIEKPDRKPDFKVAFIPLCLR